MARKIDTSLHAVTPVAGYSQVTATDVKDWAEKNGFTVHRGRGRLRREVIDAYNAAQARSKRQYVIASAPQPKSDHTYTTASGREGKFSATAAEVRAWASEAGLGVPSRGRLPQSALDAYGRAHAKKRGARKAKAAATE